MMRQNPGRDVDCGKGSFVQLPLYALSPLWESQDLPHHYAERPFMQIGKRVHKKY